MSDTDRQPDAAPFTEEQLASLICIQKGLALIGDDGSPQWWPYADMARRMLTALRSSPSAPSRSAVLEEAACELERAFEEADTYSLLHGAARVRALKNAAPPENRISGKGAGHAALEPSASPPAAAAPGDADGVALRRAAYALFQLKRFVDMPQAAIDFCREEHSIACAALDGPQGADAGNISYAELLKANERQAQQLKEQSEDIARLGSPGDDARDAARYRWLRGAYSIMPGAPGKRPIGSMANDDDLSEQGRSPSPEKKVVAWLHRHKTTAFVITDTVKNIWLKVNPTHVENYTVPLYFGDTLGNGK